MRRVTRYFAHYLSLIGLIVFALLGLLFFRYDSQFEAAAAIALGVAFVVWGTVHHWLHEGLHIKLILEYLGIAVLGVMVLLSLIWVS